jgi:hypothetical protein
VKFLVRVYDVSLRLLMSPDTVLDSGLPILPQASVWNRGNVTVVGYLEFRVDSTYYSRRDVNLIAGGASVFTAPDPWYPLPGHPVMTCSLFILPPDICVAWDLETLNVRGAARESLWTEVMMADTIDTTDFEPHALCANLGSDTATFYARFSIFDSGGPRRLYIDSAWVRSMPPGDTWQLLFEVTCITQPGPYLALASVDFGGGACVDSFYFWVVGRLGVEEAMSGECRAMNAEPTVLRRLPPGAVAFDATGRRVLNPKSGILFVQERSAVGGGRTAVHVRKVVLQR